MSARVRRLAFAAALLLCAAAAAQPASKQEAWEPELDRLLAAHQYAAAIKFLDDPKLRSKSETRLLARLVSATLEGYATAIEFHLFAFKDLEPGETVQAVRGQPGTYQIFNLDLDARLAQAYRKHAGSPELNFAIGRWIDAMEQCGCGKSSALAQDGRTDANYFLVAERAGLSDARALFRIGVDHQSRGELEAARGYYERSLALDPDEIAAQYNLAGALLKLGDYTAAKRAIDATVGRYKDPNLDADAYQVRGLVELELGEIVAAERDFRRALELNPVHATSFQNLLYIKIKQADGVAYEAEALRYISQDLANPLMFNHYVDELNDRGLHAYDHAVERRLLALDPKEPKARATVYINLARMAWIEGRLDDAAARFKVAREAFVAQADRPAGVVEQIDGALAELTRKARERASTTKR